VNNHTARAARGRALATCLLLSSTACYRTQPVVAAQPPTAGSRVVVTLSPAGTAELASQLGPGVVRAEGVVSQVRGDTLALELTRTAVASGADNLWQRQPVTIPPSAVASIAERRLDRTRSWVVAGIGVGLATLAAILATGGGGSTGVGAIVTPPN
jgi:hypothetical protein